MATRSSKIEDRVAALEKAMELVTEKLKKLETMSVGIDEVKNSVAARDVVSLEMEEKVVKMEKQIGEVASKLEAMILEQDKEWPALVKKDDDDFTLVERKKERRSKEIRATEQRNKSTAVGTKVSMAQELERCEREVVVVGDSLARGVGYKLREQCGDMVSVKAESGAKLGVVSKFVESMDKDDNRQLVVVAGANSVEKESAEALLDNFGKIIDAGKNSSSEVVMVGLVKRYDLNQTYECKRIVVNAKLKALCRTKGAKFIEYEPERSRVHSDGLHLNFRGQIELGLRIYPFAINFLV